MSKTKETYRMDLIKVAEAIYKKPQSELLEENIDGVQLAMSIKRLWNNIELEKNKTYEASRTYINTFDKPISVDVHVELARVNDALKESERVNIELNEKIMNQETVLCQDDEVKKPQGPDNDKFNIFSTVDAMKCLAMAIFVAFMFFFLAASFGFISLEKTVTETTTIQVDGVE